MKQVLLALTLLMSLASFASSYELNNMHAQMESDTCHMTESGELMKHQECSQCVLSTVAVLNTETTIQYFKNRISNTLESRDPYLSTTIQVDTPPPIFS